MGTCYVLVLIRSHLKNKLFQTSPRIIRASFREHFGQKTSGDGRGSIILNKLTSKFFTLELFSFLVIFCFAAISALYFIIKILIFLWNVSSWLSESLSPCMDLFVLSSVVDLKVKQTQETDKYIEQVQIVVLHCYRAVMSLDLQ